MQFTKYAVTSPEAKPVQGSKGATKANDTFKSLADFIKTLKAGEGTRISLKDAGLVANNGKPIEPGPHLRIFVGIAISLRING